VSTLRALPADAQVLVLDDASVDDTGDRVRALRDRRVSVVRSDVASGVAGALNQLLSMAEGDLVARMDADDLTLPGRFAHQIAMFRKPVDFVFGGVLHFGEGLRAPYPSPPLPISTAAFPTALLLGNPVAHSTMVARRSAVLDMGGYRNCLAEDYDLWLRAAAAGRHLARSGRPVVALRRHRGQVTATRDWSGRAAAEHEWQEAYASVVKFVFSLDETDPLLEKLRTSPTLEAKRALIGPLLDADRVRYKVGDRLSMSALIRR
jgi:glycosyltransferase involved in cell wall biosynthesis